MPLNTGKLVILLIGYVQGIVIVEAGKLPALIAVANICLAMSDT